MVSMIDSVLEPCRFMIFVAYFLGMARARQTHYHVLNHYPRHGVKALLETNTLMYHNPL